MPDGGITSQFGFEYQKTVFINTIVEKMQMDRKFSYEYLDDISFEDSELLGTMINENYLIQCKTGTVNDETLVHVYANWLKYPIQEKYFLYSENEIKSKNDYRTIRNKMFEKITNYKITKKSNKNSIIFILKKKYNLFDSWNDIKCFLRDLKCIFDKTEIKESNNTIIENETQKKFIDNYCHDLVLNAPKNKRYERFAEIIIDRIRKSLLNREKFTIDFKEYNAILFDIAKSINDEKYEITFFTFKKNKEKLLNDLLSSREGKFLKKMFENDKVIADYLLSELYYQDLRNFYNDSEKKDDIENIEYRAYINYEEEKDSFDDYKDIFKNVIKKQIDDKILCNKNYNNGCYIYLSSDYAPNDFFIDWCGENERKTND